MEYYSIMCTLVHSIFMNIVGTLHFFRWLYVCVCIYWVRLLFTFMWVTFVAFDQIRLKVHAKLEIEWEMLNEIQAIYSNSVLINCICLFGSFFSVWMHTIYSKELEWPNQQVHQTWFPFDGKISTRMTFVDLLSISIALFVCFLCPPQPITCLLQFNLSCNWCAKLQFYCIQKRDFP